MNQTLPTIHTPTGECPILPYIYGRIRWFWPQLLRHWGRKSTKRPSAIVVRAGTVWAVAKYGDWGRIKGLSWTYFSSIELACKACLMVQRELDVGYLAHGE